jgi:hypothetical protein
VRRIAELRARHDKSVGIFVARTVGTGRFGDLGISVFLTPEPAGGGFERHSAGAGGV